MVRPLEWPRLLLLRVLQLPLLDACTVDLDCSCVSAPTQPPKPATHLVLIQPHWQPVLPQWSVIRLPLTVLVRECSELTPLPSGCCGRCRLNGVCIAGACECEPAWEGKQCERFAFLPTPTGSDIREAGVSTWGGGFLQKKIGGEHHAFVAEFVGGCGVASWRTNSGTSARPP